MPCIFLWILILRRRNWGEGRAPALREIASPDSMEEFFEKEWVRSLFSLAVETLRGECEQRGKAIHFRLFEIYDLEDHGAATRASYDDLARDLASRLPTLPIIFLLRGASSGGLRSRNCGRCARARMNFAARLA